jgi:hypothetical protein
VRWRAGHHHHDHLHDVDDPGLHLRQPVMLDERIML